MRNLSQFILLAIFSAVAVFSLIFVFLQQKNSVASNDVEQREGFEPVEREKTRDERIRELQLEQIKVMREMDSERRQWLDTLIDRHREQQEIAAKELERLQEQRKQVTAKREDIIKEANLHITKIRKRQDGYREAAKKLTRTQEERTRVKWEDISKVAEQRIKVRDKWTDILVNDIQSSRGAIGSGRGLNILLEQLGPVAEEHEYQVRELKADIADLKAAINLNKQIEVPGQGLSEIEQELLLKETALELIEELQGASVLSPEDIRRLKYKMGYEKSALSVMPGQKTLHINWHIFDQMDGFEYKKTKSSLEYWKAEAIKELESQHYVSGATLKWLYTAVEKLTRDVEEYRKKEFGHLNGRINRWKRNFFEQVRPEVKRINRDFTKLFEARYVQDIRPSEEFNGQTVNELLAYLSRNGLSFYEDSTGNSMTSQTHQRIHKEMVKFMVGLKTIQQTILEGEERLEREKERQEDLADEELERLDRLESVYLEKRFESFFKDFRGGFQDSINNNSDLGSLSINTRGEKDGVLDVAVDQALRTMVDGLLRGALESNPIPEESR